MQFRVPQFIDMEDKVIGPFTLKQFAYVIGALGFSFLIWTFIPIKTIAIILIMLVAGLFLSLAFLKINTRPFGVILENAFTYYKNNKIYTWKQPSLDETLALPAEKAVTEAVKEVSVSKINKDRLHDVALGLDVFDRNPQNDERV